jgi:NAD(P)H-hydrate epimerase
VIVSGPAHATGAARLAARGALRVGAGLVSVASPPDAVAVNAAQLTAIMVKPFDGAEGLCALLGDGRIAALALGPGCGVGEGTRALAACALESRAGIVLDADALTSFAGAPAEMFRRLRAPCVLTPHAGEFERLFPGLLAQAPSKLEAARNAARIAGAVVLLKGPDTVVAAPDGRAAINANAPPFLATAGAGDVLAGMIAGLLAQGMDDFAAANAAVWLHGEAANRFGLGLIAEDIPEMLPAILQALHAEARAGGNAGTA